MKMLNLIQSLARFGMNSDGCQRMRDLCERLGNPQDKLCFIHVGGTNGKGSTCHMVSSVLIEQGYKVGVYISPALYKFNERITINNEQITDLQLENYFPNFSKIINQFKNHPLGEPTEFEVVTALAFKFFADMKIDYVVLEVGLGGRFDATNIVIPEVAAITNIDLDHTDILGNTVSEIAFEKAGIIKDNVPIVLGVMEVDAERVITSQASKKNAPVYKAANVNIKPYETELMGHGFIYNGEKYELGLLGEHQLENVRLVITILDILKQKKNISDSAIKAGLKNANWPGRFEIITLKDKTVILDVAHNPKSMLILQKNLKAYFKNEIATFVIGIFKDKDTDEMLNLLKSEQNLFIITKPTGERGMDSSSLSSKSIQMGLNVLYADDSIERAVEYALNLGTDLICICGSFNIVGPARNYLKGEMGSNCKR